nr:MAG TPA: hypothetical protein [Bacteriophage sp.]
MKIYSTAALEIAQQAAREAVELGVKNGGEFDWGMAMIWLQIATGHAPVRKYEERGIRSIIAHMEGKDEG